MPSYTGAVPRDNWEKHGERPSVLDFGATGDGTTNDTAAFQAALNTGREIFVPDGQYRIDPVSMASGGRLIGAGQGAVLLPRSTSQTHMLAIDGGSFATRKTYARVSNLKILNDLGANSTRGINIAYANHIYLSDLVIDGFGVNCAFDTTEVIIGTRVRLQGANHSTATASRNLYGHFTDSSSGPYYGGWIWFTDSEFNQSHGDLSVECLDTASLVFRNCQIVGNAHGDGVYVAQTVSPTNKATFIVFENCDVDSNRGYGLHLYKCREVALRGNWISSGREGSAHGVLLESCDHSTVSGNQIFWCGNDGLHLENCTRINVQGNTAVGNQHVGIHVFNCSRCSIVGNSSCNDTSFDGQGYAQESGIIEQGGSDYNAFVANIANNNTSTDIYYSGAHTLFIGHTGGGAGVNVDGGTNSFLYFKDGNFAGDVRAGGFVKAQSLIASQRVKTDTGVSGAAFLQSTDSSNPSVASFALFGEAAQANRHLDIQTSEGTTNDGTVRLQPHGGRVLIGPATDDGTNAFQVQGTVRISDPLKVTAPGDASTDVLTTDGLQTVKNKDLSDPSNTFPSLGGVATQSVVTGSRALGTVYHNTTGKPMFVSVIVVVPSGNSVVGYTDSTTSPTTGVAQYGNSTGSSASFSTGFWVLPGNYYKVAGGASTLSTWTEWY